MTVRIGADACPVTRIAERVAGAHGIPAVLRCDTITCWRRTTVRFA